MHNMRNIHEYNMEFDYTESLQKLIYVRTQKIKHHSNTLLRKLIYGCIPTGQGMKSNVKI